MQREYSSRLARRQGKKIIRQSTMMIILAILGAIIFIFVIMPQIIQLFFRIFGSGDVNFIGNDTVPPQVPVLLTLVEATNQDTIESTGYGEAGSQVVIVRNGEETGKTDVNSEGQFSYTLELVDGDNAVNLYGVDETGNESSTRTVLIIRDTEAPSLAFEALENGKQITLRSNQNLTIRGETEPGSQLTLNDRSVYVNSDGTFSTTYYLQEGDNVLRFVVTDEADNRTEREVTVNFRY